MSITSYPYSTAHKHAVELVEEVSKLDGIGFQTLIQLSEVVATLSKKAVEVQNSIEENNED